MYCTIVEISVGKLLKKLMDERGITGRQLAIRVNDTSGHISQILSGQVREPRPSLMVRIADVLGVPLEIFYRDDIPKPDEPTTPTIDKLTKMMKELHDSYQIVEIPIIGAVSAGGPCPSDEADEGKLLIAKGDLPMGVDYEKLYSLRVKGSSLTGYGVEDGYKLLVLKDAEIVDGGIYIIRMADGDCCARRVYKANGYFRLQSSDGSEIQAAEVDILGRAIKAYKDIDLTIQSIANCN